MTRATLLHVLERPTALGPAEVRELEQLAQAFPYCQTAHLLLAKAAHDQGTMLAGQRLRRAATYAADRALLRRLIEQQEPAELPAAPEPVVPPPAPHPLDLVDWPDEYVPPSAAPPLPVAEATPAEALRPITPPLVAPPAPASPVAEMPVAAEIMPPPLLPASPEQFVLPEPELEAVPEPQLPAAAPPVVSGPAGAVAVEEAEAAAPTEVPVGTPVAATETPATVALSVATTPTSAHPEAKVAAAVVEPQFAATLALIAAVKSPTLEAVVPATLPTTVLPLAGPLSALATPPEPAASPVAEVAASLAAEVPEAELPAQAPAIRPPVEVGEARFEFGLADPAPAVAVPTYELPGLVDEWAASAVTRGMGRPAGLILAPVAPVFTPAAFTGDAVVGYAFGESSRLGLSMQLLDLLTAKAEAAESTTAVMAAAQPPASALPPTGTFFEPDPLLLEHWATHRPAPPELPSTVDLINNFLKRQPRLTRPAMLPPAAGGQADLSVRSTRAEPDLVSENLARIFVRQGKTARAVEIYEKLMVKQPEKMAYFALQIQSLQPSA